MLWAVLFEKSFYRIYVSAGNFSYFAAINEVHESRHCTHAHYVGEILVNR